MGNALHFGGIVETFVGSTMFNNVNSLAHPKLRERNRKMGNKLKVGVPTPHHNVCKTWPNSTVILGNASKTLKKTSE
jgi:hypothetical protein